ncbi:MAG: hypothetical protein ACJA2W_002243 [Planctomycetota bacterium]|jgi:hypothetical protein
MITHKQKLALGGLVTLSAAIWTPQVLQRFASDDGTKASVSSGPDESEMIDIDRGGSAGSPMGAGFSVAPPMAMAGVSGTGSLPSSGSAPLESTLDNRSPMAGGTAPVGANAIVSEVLRTLRQSEAFGVENKVVGTTAQIEFGEEVPEPEVLPELVAFVQENPLRGTIVGETYAVALIGKMRVRLGENVPGTGAFLTKIERGRATLNDGGLIIELELRPLETSAALMQEREGNGAGASTGAVDTGPSETGDGGLQTTESNPAGSTSGPLSDGNQDTNNHPSGSQGDF